MNNMNMREATPPMTKNCRHDDPFVVVLPLFMSTFLTTLWALSPDEEDGSGGSIVTRVDFVLRAGGWWMSFKENEGEEGNKRREKESSPSSPRRCLPPHLFIFISMSKSLVVALLL